MENIFFIFAILVSTPYAIANDMFAEVGIGGIEMKKTDHIKMLSEKLYISENKIEVNYKFINTSDRNETVDVAFPMPTVDCSNLRDRVAGCETSTLGLKFETWINGNKIKTNLDEQAIVNGKDITHILKKYKISPSEYDFAAIKELPSNTLKVLTDNGIIQEGDLETKIGWELRRTFYWKYNFEKGKVVKVKHIYQPIAGSTHYLENGLNRENDHVREYCIDEGIKNRILAKAKEIHKVQKIEEGIAYHWVSYILRSANSWSGPIEDFELDVKKSFPEQIVATCFSGLKRVDKMTFRVKIKNFTPNSDIKILFWPGKFN